MCRLLFKLLVLLTPLSPFIFLIVYSLYPRFLTLNMMVIPALLIICVTPSLWRKAGKDLSREAVEMVSSKPYRVLYVTLSLTLIAVNIVFFKSWLSQLLILLSIYLGTRHPVQLLPKSSFSY